ncbi:MAG: BREX-6 system BrxE protein [Myxococcales bacterium]|nr:BREX-6 system BrxE protein [Myxococcales bacterium]
MSAQVSDNVLDKILAVQLTVAWAGEAKCEPPRLGWWNTDLIDEAGGGDFFARLLPKTHAWASLEAVREAARRVDAEARRKTANPDAMRTLFFLGFELDEQLDDRLAMLKRDSAGDKAPSEALELPIALGAKFDKEALRGALTKGGTEEFKREPAGRQLKGPLPTEPQELVRRLAAALVPLSDNYPLPYFKVEA